MNNCLSNCSSNGLCSYITSTNSFGCECDEYFSGSSCQIDLRPCSSNPCLNNGTCIQNITHISNPTYFCECDKYFEGSVCQNKIDLCQNQTCSKQGNCIEVNNEPVCVCHNLYEGDECEIQSATLITVKKVISTASIIAIAMIILFYSMFVVSDILNIFMRKKANQVIDAEQELFRNAIK